MKKQALRKLVHLIAFTQDGRQVHEQFLNVDLYYEESHPLLDEAEFRRVRKIIRICGKQFDATTAIVEEFELRYNAAGVLVREGSRLGDGTVIGDWHELAAGG
ncbi:MAG TPA: hypothetical protein VH280_00690 [Verrucomicrobiae bacterium]|jgi:hypothetical protein|nr:hypothetical protein [Verrucomicrobiae bacterium]